MNRSFLLEGPDSNNIARVHLTSKHKGARSSLALLCLLVVLDLTLVALHIGYSETNWRLALYEEGSYSEIFQYLKEFVVALVLALAAVRSRSLLYLGWSLLFLYVLLDDYLQIHEQWGWLISEELRERRWIRLLREAAGLKSLTFQSFGELIVWGFFGLLFLALIGGAYYLARPLPREHARNLFALLVVFALCGVALDMVGIPFEPGSTAHYILGIAEDGGELLVMSVILFYALRIAERCFR